MKKFEKDSMEWMIFGSVWKFYQAFYEPEPDEPLEDFISRMAIAVSKLREPLEGKPTYGLMKNLTGALVADISDRLDERAKKT